jgi:hypothetical protein
MTVATIAALNVYPVKSCRGIARSDVLVQPRGFVADGAGDREWMVVDGDGRFLTQRDTPALTRITTTVAGDRLVLGAGDGALLFVPLAAAAGPTRPVVVWRSTVAARDEGDAAAAWLARVLGRDARLVRFDPADRRPCNPDWVGASGAHTAFADGYPVLVIGEASLAELNARLAAGGTPPLPMNRFRPNVVLAGLDPYAEDHLETIETQGVVLRLVKPCTRCPITTTDQDSGVRGVEPLPTLGAYRHNARLDGVTFGMNAIVVAGAGRRLAVGAEVRCEYRF